MPTPDADAVESSDTSNTDSRDSDLSLNDLCNALYTSAQDNDLPVPFFANLIWQESRLRDDAVSRKGALGIAQFMPETAAETGLDNPFDPLKPSRRRRASCASCACNSAISALSPRPTMPARAASSNGSSIARACRAKRAAMSRA